MKPKILLILLFINIQVFSQVHISAFGNMDKYIDSTEYKFKEDLWKSVYFNNNLIKFKEKYKEKFTFVLENGVKIDSFNFKIHGYFFNKKDTCLYIEAKHFGQLNCENTISILQLNLNTLKIKNIKDDFHGSLIGISGSDLLITIEDCNDTIVTKVFQLNPRLKKIKELFSLPNEFVNYNISGGNNIYFDDIYNIQKSSKIIFEIYKEDREYPGDPSLEYFKFDKKTKESELLDLKKFDFLFYKLDANNQFIPKLCHGMLSIIAYNNFIAVNDQLLDENLIFKNKGVSFKEKPICFQIYNNKILTYFASGELKSKTVYFPYRSIYELNRNMYLIDMDSLVNESDLKKLEQVDLKILFNTVYDKNGYIFPSDYLNLYFKNVAFDKEHKDLSDDKSLIESKFTAIDKQNLAIINKYIVKPDLSKYSSEQISQTKAIISSIDTLSMYIYSNQNQNSINIITILKL